MARLLRSTLVVVAAAVCALTLSKLAVAVEYGVTNMYSDPTCFTGAWPTSIFVVEYPGCVEDLACTLASNESIYYYEIECTDDYKSLMMQRYPDGEYLLEATYNADNGCFNWYGVSALPLDGSCHPYANDGSVSIKVIAYTDGSVSLEFYLGPTCEDTTYSWQQYISAANIDSDICQKSQAAENSTSFYNTYERLVVSTSGSTGTSGSINASVRKRPSTTRRPPFTTSTKSRRYLRAPPRAPAPTLTPGVTTAEA